MSVTTTGGLEGRRGARGARGGAGWGLMGREFQLGGGATPGRTFGLNIEKHRYSRVLVWRIPGTGKPGGLPSMGSHRVGHD